MEPKTYKVEVHSVPKVRNLKNKSPLKNVGEPTVHPVDRKKEIPNDTQEITHVRNIDISLIPVCSTKIIKRNVKETNEDISLIPVCSTKIIKKNFEEINEDKNIKKEIKPLLTKAESLKPDYFNKDGVIQPKGTFVFRDRIKPTVLYSTSKDKISERVEEIKTVMNDKFISFYSTDDETPSPRQNNSKHLIEDIIEGKSRIFDTVIKPFYSSAKEDIVRDIFGQQILKEYGENFRSKTHSEMGDSNNELTKQQFQAYSMSVRVNRKNWSKSKHRRGEHVITPTKFKETPKEEIKNIEIVQKPERPFYTYVGGRRGKHMMQQILIVTYLLFLSTGLTLAFIYYNLTSDFNTLAGWGMPLLVPASVILIIIIDFIMETIFIMRSIILGFILSLATVLLNALLYSALGINRQTRVFYIGFIDLSFTMFIIFVMSFYKYRYHRVMMFLEVFMITLFICCCSIGLDTLIATISMEPMEKIALIVFTIGYIMFTTAEIYLIANDYTQVYRSDFVYAGFIAYNGFIDLTVKSFCFLVINLLPKKNK